MDRKYFFPSEENQLYCPKLRKVVRLAINYYKLTGQDMENTPDIHYSLLDFKSQKHEKTVHCNSGFIDYNVV